MLKPSVNKEDHITGPENASITLVEYGDYECPYCGQAYLIIKNVQQQMEDNLRFVFRNFPLQESHPDAFGAAVAAEAAGKQNAFWQTHDTLFENQDRLGDNDLLAYAAKLKLNVKTFTTDIKNPALKYKVEADLESGVRSGVNGTPTFFINGSRYDGSWEEEEFTQYLKSLIQ